MLSGGGLDLNTVYQFTTLSDYRKTRQAVALTGAKIIQNEYIFLVANLDLS